MTQWHYSLNGQQLGPVSPDELQRLLAAGVLNNVTLVWREGLEDWVPLAVAIRELQPAAAPVMKQPAPGDAPPLPVYQSAQLSDDQPEQTHSFEFRGRAGEFFRIWIVNVVLTVLTLGIYAAWAKVRTRRYFYGNTLLDGKPFDFTGNPIAILKSNLIFGGLFIVYVVSGALFPPFALFVAMVIFGFAPWLIAKALRFRAHNTMHRNVRFNFRGTIGESYGVFLGLALLIPFTLGFIVPYTQFRQKQYFLGNMGWGNATANMRGQAGFYYKTFFKIVAVLILFGVMASLVTASIFAMQRRSRPTQETTVQTQRQSTQPPSQLHRQENNTSVQKPQDHRPGALGAAESGILVSVFCFYALAFGAGIYYKVRTNNYALNSTEWGRLGRLSSSVRVRDLIWLYFTNGLAVLCSLGLAIPWVKIRMARYVASRTLFIASGSLDSVAQAYSATESAMGDAGADIFDFEVGF